MNENLPPRAIALLKRKVKRRLPAFCVDHNSYRRFADSQSMEYVVDGLPSENDAGHFGVPSAKPSSNLEENSVGCFDDCCILSDDGDEAESELMTSSATTPSPKLNPKNKPVDEFEDVDCFEGLLPSCSDDPFLSVDTPIPSSGKPKSAPESHAPTSLQATEPIKSPAQGNDSKPKQNRSFTVLNELIDEDYLSNLQPSPSSASIQPQKPTQDPTSPRSDTLSPNAIQKTPYHPKPRGLHL